MDIQNIILGLISIVLGILIIAYYQKQIKIKKRGMFFFKLQNAGVILIIIGIGLIIRGCK